MVSGMVGFSMNLPALGKGSFINDVSRKITIPIFWGMGSLLRISEYHVLRDDAKKHFKTKFCKAAPSIWWFPGGISVLELSTVGF
jgi:hypothetical protein